MVAPELLLLLLLLLHNTPVASAVVVAGPVQQAWLVPVNGGEENVTACRLQMQADGCLRSDGLPARSARQCGDCAKAHGPDLLAHNCTFDTSKQLCEAHAPPAPYLGRCGTSGGGVVLQKQLSKSACTINVSFGCCSSLAMPVHGCNSTSIWTSSGCRGEFMLGNNHSVTCDSTSPSTEPQPCVPKPPPPPAPCFTGNNTAFACTASCFCTQRWSSDEINSTDHIQYSSVYNLSLHMWQPPASDTRTRRPAAVGIHGGGFETGNRNTDAFVQGWARKLAQRGFVTVSIDYRLEGLKPTKKNPLGAEKSNTDAMYDAKAAVRWLRMHAQELRVDPDRIAAFGCSAGAMTTAFLCGVGDTKGEGNSGNPGYSSDVQAGVALSGALIELNYLNVAENKDLKPYLDFHGCKDHTVPYDCPAGVPSKKTLECWGSGVDTVEVMNAKRPGVAHLYSFPGAGHCPHGDVEKGPAMDAMLGFLSEHLDLAHAECPPNATTT
jgi:dienelactone hydrolase